MIYLFVILGGLIGFTFLKAGGIVPGMCLGFLFFQTHKTKDQVDTLSRRLKYLEKKTKPQAKAQQQAAPNFAKAASPKSSPPIKDDRMYTAPLKKEEQAPAIEPDKPSAPAIESEPQTKTPNAMPIIEPPAAKIPPPRYKQPIVEEDPLGVWAEKAKEFFIGGNLFARLGVALLFIGLSFLVKLAIDNQLFPIELRLAGAGLIGAALVGFGWQLKDKRPAYGLTLQGGGIAILYLTVFASFRLYDLLDAQFAFILLVLITLFGASIAVYQNAQSLAVLSLLGGFLAPVIASTGSNNHVTLFSYYVILNAGILLMAWNKPWRVLHLTGFFSTFAIGTLWGGLSYNPDLFYTTQPFLIIFFVCYFGIALLYATRHGLSPKKLVDGTLVFGLPLIAFSLQAVLVDPFEYGLAWSALAMAVFYGAAAWFLYQRKPLMQRALIEAFAGIGIAFLSMTIPFALDATWTGAGWALEAAVLIWLGIRQRRILVRAGGYLLMVLALVSFAFGEASTSGAMFDSFRFLMNPSYMGYLVLSLSSLFVSYQADKHKARLLQGEGVISILLLITGVFLWSIGGIYEIERTFSLPLRMNLIICFCALSAICIAGIGRRLNWIPFQQTALFVIPALYWFYLITYGGLSHPFSDFGFIAWPLALVACYYALHRNEEAVASPFMGYIHAVVLWLVALVLTRESRWVMTQGFDAQSVWPELGFYLVPAALVSGIVWLSNRSNWPVGQHRKAYLHTAIIPILLFAWGRSIAASLLSSAAPTPFPYLPILNPFDIVLGIGVIAGRYWYKTVDQDQATPFTDFGREYITWTMVVTGFIWMNATIARTIHHWTDLPYSSALFESSIFQSAISICWTLLAVTVMAIAARRGARTPWLAAAGLLAIVTVKLVLIDLSSLTTLHKVISFMGVGVLFLVIGYIAPAPPKEKPASTSAQI